MDPVIHRDYLMQVSFISINAEPTADVPATVIAHELVSFLRDSGVEFVGVIGAGHLAAAAPGKVYCCSPCASKGQTQSAAVTEIRKSATELPGVILAACETHILKQCTRTALNSFNAKLAVCSLFSYCQCRLCFKATKSGNGHTSVQFEVFLLCLACPSASLEIVSSQMQSCLHASHPLL